mgnify:CR=1 FL=1
MNSTSDDPRVLLFPSCDRDGHLLDAIARADDGPATRADAVLFGWMLGLDAAVDAVGAARAVLAVVDQRSIPENAPGKSAYRRALIGGLERFVADRGRVASLSAVSASGGIRPRHRLRDRGDETRPVVTATPERREESAEGVTRLKKIKPRD